MPVCQFGERQFELAANLELIAGSGSFFAPPTPLEGNLGVDAALTPGDPKIWHLLGLASPRGAQVGPKTFSRWPAAAPGGATPPFLVSLFVQYKRSTYLTRSWSKEWETHGGPFWRVDLSTRQYKVLRNLEQQVGGLGAVRYAAPRFWRYEDMWQQQASGTVLDNALFFAPSDLHQPHERVTWSRAQGLVGHSRPEPIRSETARDLATDLRRRVRQQRSAPGHARPRAYLDLLAAALEDLAPSRRGREEWAQEVRETVARDEADVLPPETVEALAGVSVIAEVAHAARATSLIVEVSELPAEHDSSGSGASRR